jgi:hypothetical protein
MGKRVQGKYAFGYCDRTGFRYPIHELVDEFVQGRPTGLKVGRDQMDPDHPQNWLGRLHKYDDAQAIEDPRPDLGQAESRGLFSFNPVGLGGLLMVGDVGVVSTTTDPLPGVGDGFSSGFDSGFGS